MVLEGLFPARGEVLVVVTALHCTGATCRVQGFGKLCGRPSVQILSFRAGDNENNMVVVNIYLRQNGNN